VEEPIALETQAGAQLIQISTGLGGEAGHSCCKLFTIVLPKTLEGPIWQQVIAGLVVAAIVGLVGWLFDAHWAAARDFVRAKSVQG
jgi:hypothetical protein